MNWTTTPGAVHARGNGRVIVAKTEVAALDSNIQMSHYKQINHTLPFDIKYLIFLLLYTRERKGGNKLASFLCQSGHFRDTTVLLGRERFPSLYLWLVA